MNTTAYNKNEWRSMAASLLIKSVRIGWPNGVEAAARVLGISKTKSYLWAQVWEDIFPDAIELPAIAKEIAALDYEALCRRETHHGMPGVTQKWFDIWIETKKAIYPYNELYRTIKRFEPRAAVTPRTVIAAGIWVYMAGGIPGLNRTLDEHLFIGVPVTVYDKHVKFREKRGEPTILTGTFEQHLNIANMVQDCGWDFVREQAHSEGIVEGSEVLQA
jgi:hypothetical protein